MKPVGHVVVIHGGTGARPPIGRLRNIRQRLTRILEATDAYARTHTAVESVVFAVHQLEDDPLFNAGTGSALQQDGQARMSASVMDGRRRQFAAVINLERVRHPIAVAQALLNQPDRILAGSPATRFARALGLPPWNPITPERLQQWRHRRRGQHGTVGALVLDREGHLAAATSTGGRGFERPGRVSDSGLPVGNYALPAVAISCTGYGEDIIDEALAVRLAQQVSNGTSLAHAFGQAHRDFMARHRRAGAIGLDRHGRVVWMTTLPALFAMAQTPRRRLASFSAA